MRVVCGVWSQSKVCLIVSITARLQDCKTARIDIFTDIGAQENAWIVESWLLDRETEASDVRPRLCFADACPETRSLTPGPGGTLAAELGQHQAASLWISLTARPDKQFPVAADWGAVGAAP